MHGFFKVILTLAILLPFWGCGGTHNEGSSKSLKSIVAKLKAQYSQISSDSDNPSQMEITFDGKKLIVTAQYAQEGAPVFKNKFEEKMRPTNSIPSLPIEYFTIWKPDVQEIDVPGREVIALLIEQNVDILIQEKDKNGTLITEVLLDGEKMKERIKNWEERERTNEIILAKIETGTYTDPRNNHVYRTGTIIGETWIADDIVHEGENLYTWDEAKKACPEGWRLPSAEELKSLRFLKFRWEYIDYKQKPSFWSSSMRDGLFGEEVVAIQPNDDGAAEIGIPTNLANSPEKRNPVRCIKE